MSNQVNENILKREFKLDDPYAIDAFIEFNQIKDEIGKKQKGKIANELDYIVRICENIKGILNKSKNDVTLKLVTKYIGNVKLFKEFFMGRISSGDFLLGFEPLSVIDYSDIKDFSFEEFLLFENSVENLEKSVKKLSHLTGRNMSKKNLSVFNEAYTYVFSSLIGSKGAIELYKIRQLI